MHIQPKLKTTPRKRVPKPPTLSRSSTPSGSGSSLSSTLSFIAIWLQAGSASGGHATGVTYRPALARAGS